MNYLRNILLLWLLLALQVATTACTSSTKPVLEAERIVAMADSMDAEHLLYSDTAALCTAICTLDRPVRRHRYRNALAAAYYYMGRNMSLNSDYARAADCYIACDRLHPDDPIRRGRVNACMAYICTQQGEDSLALVFYKRSSQAFYASGNSWYYAHSLLNQCRTLLHLHRLGEADSLWHMAKAYRLDSAYEARAIEIRGLYFYEQQRYDSALLYYLQAAKYPADAEYRCYTYMKIARIYESTDMSTQAYPYAEYIVQHSTNPALISNAYYTLINYAEQIGDAALVAAYSHNREDAGREKRALSNRNSAAVEKCRQYLANPYPNRKWHIVVGVAVLLCGILGTAILLLRYRKRKDIKQKDTLIRQQHLLLREKDMQIQQQCIQAEELSAQLQVQKTTLQQTRMYLQHAEQQLQQQTDALQDLARMVHTSREPEVILQLEHLRIRYPQPDKSWNTYLVLKKDIGHTLLGVCKQLEQKSLSHREITVCICSLIYKSLTLADLAQYLCYSQNSIRTTRTRIAKKLGIDSAARLHEYLMDLAVYGTDVHHHSSTCIHQEITIR